LGKRITSEMIYQRKIWIEEQSGISLEIEQLPFGWLLYQDLSRGRLKQISFGATKQEFFRQLQFGYALLMAIKERDQEQEKIKEEIVK
jgi:hypothetical protein